MAAWLNINDYLASYEKDRRASLEEQIRQHKENTSNTFLAYALLAGEGFTTGTIERWKLEYDNNFKVENVRDFTKIHRAVGPLKEYTRKPEGDGRTRNVRVVLQPKDPQFAHLKFWYMKKLPKPDKRKGKENQPKCRLVTRTYKETVLVCDNSKDG